MRSLFISNSSMNAKYKILVSILLTAALAITFRLVVGKPAENKAEREAFWASKSYDNNQYNILFLGDSRVYRSLNPEVIERKIPTVKVKNLGYSALGFDSAYMRFASSQMTVDEPVKIYVIGLSPRSISTSAIGNESFVEWTTKSGFDVWKIRDMAGLNEFFCPYTPQELYDRFIKKELNQNFGYQDLNKNGFVGSIQVPFTIQEGLETYERELSSASINSNAVQDILDFVQSCTRQNIHVIFFRPPSMKEMEKIENSIQGYNEEELAVKLIQSGAIRWQPSSVCASYDASHIDFISADKLSHELALFLQLKFPSIRQSNK